MRSFGTLVLLTIVGFFGWGMLELYDARFESGDLYPEGSSFRSDAFGLRALHDSIGAPLSKEVSRHRGRRGRLATTTDATIVVQRLAFQQLITKRDPLIEELTQAARGGARVIVTLDDSEANTCRQRYCNDTEPSRCHAAVSLEESQEPSGAPAPSSQPARHERRQPAAAAEPAPSGHHPSEPSAPLPAPSASEPSRATTPPPEKGSEPTSQGKRADLDRVPDDETCDDAALGLWGFEVGGSAARVPRFAMRGTGASGDLPPRLPWHHRAHFIELDPAYRVHYVRDGAAVVVERSLGRGSLVLVAEGYLLSNEALRRDRSSEFLLWLLGESPRVIFEESHLGVIEPRGVMSLAKELRLQGFIVGCFVLALLFAWQRLRPSTASAALPARKVGPQAAPESTLLSLLRRGMTPKQALEGCIEEAKHAGLTAVLRRAEANRLEGSAAEFNRIFCPEKERPNPR